MKYNQLRPLYLYAALVCIGVNIGFLVNNKFAIYSLIGLLILVPVVISHFYSKNN